MKSYLAIIVYRCLIAGKPDRSLDFQVKHYRAESEEKAHEAISREQHQVYKNVDGENVCWEYVETLTVEEFELPESGDEMIGFIMGVDELNRLT